MKYCFLVVIALCFSGCSNDVEPAFDDTVHLAGYVGQADLNMVASYWKDGIYTKLPKDSLSSGVNSLYVDGSSVLIGGWKFGLGSPSQTLYWRDGTETAITGSPGSTTLVASRNNNLFGVWRGVDFATHWVFHKDGTSQPIVDTALNIGPTGLALLGNDMYISGSSIGVDQNQHAQCWKNGQLIFRESEISNAMSVFVHQNDIYMAGYLYGPDFPNGMACYWKNGRRVDLTDGSVMATAWSMFVTDEHAYVSGVINQQASYWKDGEATILANEATYSNALCISVQGTDVHVGGYEDWHPAYWKNDVKQTIENADKFGQIKCIVVGSN
ncbi:MAG TPA: hypothetical protein VK658_28350 [Chryseolinea sp.]|nr:hypothetical protein [Chryseolinea sp.]